jgi:ribosomal-protein-alanine N-acetyltransferase
MVNFVIEDNVKAEEIEEIYKLETLCHQSPWSKSFFYSCLQDSIFFVAYDRDNGVIGFICGKEIGDIGCIYNLAVHPNFRRIGVATALLQRFTEKAKNDGIREIWLEVKKNNFPAINLYKKFNFEIVGVREKYYPGGEDAYLMTLKI